MHIRRKARAAAEPVRTSCMRYQWSKETSGCHQVLHALLSYPNESFLLHSQPPEVRDLVQRLSHLQLSELGAALSGFEWRFGKADLLHWADLLDRFDDLFATYVAANPALKLDCTTPPSHPQPCTHDDLLRVLYVSQTLLSNCGSRQAYGSMEHLTHLLADPDWRIAKATLELMNIATRRSAASSKQLKVNDPELIQRLEWIAHGGDGSLELVRGSDEKEARLQQLQRVRARGAAETGSPQSSGRISAFDVRLQPVDHNESPLLKAVELCVQQSVPEPSRFGVYWKLRLLTLARSDPQVALHQLSTAQALSLSTLMQCASHSTTLPRFFNSNPDAVQQVFALSVEPSVGLEWRALAASLLASMSCDRTRYLQKLLSVLNGSSQRGYLGKLCKRTIEMLHSCNCGKQERFFAGMVFQLIGSLVSSYAGASLLDEVGLPSLMMPLLEDTSFENAPLVSNLLRALDTFVERSRALTAPDAQMALLKDAYIRRLVHEVDTVVKMDGTRLHELYNRRMVVKAVLRAETILIYQPVGSTSDDDKALQQVPPCLRAVFENENRFGGSVYSHASNICCALLNQHPTCYSKLHDAGVPDAFLDSLTRGIPATSEAVLSIPSTLSAICLDTRGKAAVTERASIRALEEVLVNDEYRKVIQYGETASMLGTTLDEYMRHVPEQRQEGVNMIISCIRRIREADDDGIDLRADAIGHISEAMAANSDTAQRFVDAGGLTEFMALFTCSKLCERIRERNRSEEKMSPTLSTALRCFVTTHTAQMRELMRSSMHSVLDHLLQLGLKQQSLWSLTEGDLQAATTPIVGAESLMLLLNHTFRSSGAALSVVQMENESDTLYQKIQEAADLALAQRAYKQSSSINGTEKQQGPQDGAGRTPTQVEGIPNGSEARVVKESSSSATALSKSLDAFLESVRTVNNSLIKAASMYLRRRIPRDERALGMRDNNESMIKSLDLCKRQGIAHVTRLHLFCMDETTESYVINNATYLKQALLDLLNAVFDQRRNFSHPLLINAILAEGGISALVKIFSILMNILEKSNDGLADIDASATVTATIFQSLCNSHMVLGGPHSTTHLTIPLSGGEAGKTKDDATEKSYQIMSDIHSRVGSILNQKWRSHAAHRCNPELAERIVNTLTCIVAGAEAGLQSDRHPFDAREVRSTRVDPDPSLTETLVEMGFPRGGAERALQAVENVGVELAMDYLLSNPRLREQEDENEDGVTSNTGGEEASAAQNVSAERRQAEQSEAPKREEILQGIYEMVYIRQENVILLSVKDLLRCLVRKENEDGGEQICNYITHEMARSFHNQDQRGMYVTLHLIIVVLKENPRLCGKIKELGVLDEMNHYLKSCTNKTLVHTEWLSLILLMWYDLIQYNATGGGNSNVEELQRFIQHSEKETDASEPVKMEDEAVQLCTHVLQGVNACEDTEDAKLADAVEAAMHLLAQVTTRRKLAERFVSCGGIQLLMNLPSSVFGIDAQRVHSLEKLLANVVRHTLEDDVVLMQTMEAEIRAQLQQFGRWQGGQSLHTFLKSTESIAARSPDVFLRTIKKLCKLKSDRRISLKGNMSRSGDREAHKPSSTFTFVIESLVSAVFTDLQPAKDLASEGSKAMEIDNGNVSSLEHLWAAKKSVQLRVLTDACAMYPTAAALVVKHDSRVRGVQTLLNSLSYRTSNDGADAEHQIRNASKNLLLALSLRSPEGRKRVVHDVTARLPKVFGNIEEALAGGSQLAGLLTALVSTGSAARGRSSRKGHGIDILRCMLEYKTPSSVIRALDSLDTEDPRTATFLSLLLKALEVLTRDFVEQSAESAKTDITNSHPLTSNNRVDEEHQGIEFAEGDQEDGNNDNQLWVEPESYYTNLVEVNDRYDRPHDASEGERHGTTGYDSESVDEDMREDDARDANQQVQIAEAHADNEGEQDDEDSDGDQAMSESYSMDNDSADGDEDDDDDDAEEDDDVDDDDDEYDADNGDADTPAPRRYLGRDSSLAEHPVSDTGNNERGDVYQYVDLSGHDVNDALLSNAVPRRRGEDNAMEEEDDDIGNAIAQDELFPATGVIELGEDGMDMTDDDQNVIRVRSDLPDDEDTSSAEVIRIRTAPSAERRQPLIRSPGRQSSTLLLGAPPVMSEHPAIASSFASVTSSHSSEGSHQAPAASSIHIGDSLRAILSGIGGHCHDESNRGIRSRRFFGRADSGSRTSERESETRASVWESDARNYVGITSMQALESLLAREIPNRIESEENEDGLDNHGPRGTSRDEYEDAHMSNDNDFDVTDTDVPQEGNTELPEQREAAEPIESDATRADVQLAPSWRGDEATMQVEDHRNEQQHLLEQSSVVGEAEEIARDREDMVEERNHAGTGDEGPQPERGEPENERQRNSDDDSNQNQIDPSFLDALPPELRAEVIATHGQPRDQAPAGGATGSGGGITALTGEEQVDPEFLAALPPDIQAEVLQQQAAARHGGLAQANLFERMGEAEQEENDDDEIGIEMPSLREMTPEPATIHEHHRSHLRSPSPRPDDGNEEEVQRLRRQCDIIAGESEHMRRSTLHRDTDIKGPPLLDGKEISAILRLTKQVYKQHKNSLQKVLIHLCHHSEQRAAILKGLVHPIPRYLRCEDGGEDRLRQRQTYCSNLLEALHAVLCNHQQSRSGFNFLSIALSLDDTRKGKTKVYERDSMQQQPLFHVMADMVMIPSTSGLSSDDVEHILRILEICVRWVQDSNRKHRSEHDQSSEPQPQSSRDGQQQAAQPQMQQTRNTEQLDDPSNELEEEHYQSTKTSALQVIRDLSDSQLQRFIALIGEPDQNDTLYRRSRDVVGEIANIAEDHCPRLLAGFRNACQQLTGQAQKELQGARDPRSEERWSGCQAGKAILRLCRSATEVFTAAKNKDLSDEMIFINQTLNPVWNELGTCLSALQPSGEDESLPAGANAIIPLIEAYFELCCKDDPEKSIGHASTQELWRFAERHRGTINALIRRSPGLLSTSLKPLLKSPRLVDFDNKRKHFRSSIKKLKESYRNHLLRVYVRRSNVLDDSYQQLHRKGSTEMRGRLSVNFQGEEGVDAGGPTREWFSILAREIFNPQYALFTPCDTGGRTFQPNPNSSVNPEHLPYFRFVGRLVGKALWEDVQMDAYFTRSFYKHMLHIPVSYDDIEAIDPDFYKNLRWVIENDITNVLDLTFSTESHFFDVEETVDLKPNGRNIQVTEANKKEYVDLLCQYKMTNAIRDQINYFVHGFEEIVPHELVSIFGPGELELLISGLPEIDIDDLAANTEYVGFSPSSQVVQWFWEVVRSLNQEDRARLLQFCTGTSKVPLDGFKALQGISGPQKFQIHRAAHEQQRLISAHTCFNQLDLPEYSSKEALCEKLMLAIYEASEGFGFQ